MQCTMHNAHICSTVPRAVQQVEKAAGSGEHAGAQGKERLMESDYPRRSTARDPRVGRVRGQK